MSIEYRNDGKLLVCVIFWQSISPSVRALCDETQVSSTIQTHFTPFPFSVEVCFCFLSTIHRHHSAVHIMLNCGSFDFIFSFHSFYEILIEHFVQTGEGGQHIFWSDIFAEISCSTTNYIENHATAVTHFASSKTHWFFTSHSHCHIPSDKCVLCVHAECLNDDEFHLVILRNNSHRQLKCETCLLLIKSRCTNKHLTSVGFDFNFVS